MVISKLLKSQVAAKQKELVSKLQQQAHALYYDHMMYGINDSLTSILAVCDVEAKEAVPKIKKYIHRINQHLRDVKNYQKNFTGEEKFNISLALKNLMRVIKENYKDVKLAWLLSDIKAPVKGNQSKFERILLYIIVNMIFTKGKNSDSEILIELRQKDQNAMITALKDHHVFSDQDLEHINKIQEGDDFKGMVQITPQGRGVEVIIKAPLQFGLATVNQPVTTTEEVSKTTKVAQRKTNPVSTWGGTKPVTTPGFVF